MPDNDPSLMTIFAEALERTDPAARAAYLDAACDDDAALRRRVESLLAAHEGAGRFLEPGSRDESETAGPDTEGMARTSFPETHSGSHQPTGSPADRPGGPVPGQFIAGRYTLLDVLGEGGMGTVYRAGQTEPVKRQVALKLIKIGMDSRTVLARFDAERQALAMMDHPNIARVYDGGTTAAGQPFFVMELVDGVPITEYCDLRRLPVRARLELFVTVCQAVQHAHHKGIIHRDLKPGNVLVAEVDGRPTPKVIDFGVARATEQKLTDLSLVEAGAVVGTPAYMSPEQADPSSRDIDTRTDVYALGVILYELLAGSPPIDAKQFRRDAFLEMLRMVREIDPPRPSTRVSTSDALPSLAASRGIEPSQLKRVLRGDLDWIVMKALEKDRGRRYETANGFAADVLRHLTHEPVLAAPPSRAYRVRKFARKHRGAVLAVSVVVLALLAGIAGTTWGLIRAERRRVEAETARAAEVERAEERNAAVRVADARADELKYRLGVSDMVLAAAAYDSRDVVLAAERLDNVPPGQRGWEWHFLKRLTRGGLYTLYGHTGGVDSAAFSPDGSRIVTAGADRAAKIWDARTGRLGLELEGHMDRVTSAVFSPDSHWIVTASADGTAKVWDARTGARRFDLAGPADGVSSATFNADGSRIVTAGRDQTARVWDARTGKSLLGLKGHMSALNSAAFSPDGTCIVTASDDRTARVWDARTGKSLLQLGGHASGVESAAFSPDGSRVVTASSDTTAKVWDARTGTALLELKGHAGTVRTAAFSPDGSRVVTAGWDATARVWDARTGTALLELKGHTDMVRGAAFSPDGCFVVTASEDRTAKVWDAQAGTSRLDLEGHAGVVRTAAFSPDGSRIVTASGDQTAKVWDSRTRKSLLELKGHAGGVWTAAFSADGSRIVTGGSDRTARVWDTGTGMTLLKLEGHSDGVCSAAFNPDGSRIVTTDVGPTARVWDARTGAALLELRGHAMFVTSGAFSPDGSRIVTSAADRTAKVWDARTGAMLLELEGHSGEVWSAAFSPDGSLIATASLDRTAKVWDARTGTALVELKGHAGGVNSAAFSPDGTRIVTAGGDGKAKVWDRRTATALIDLEGHSPWMESAAFSPDGSLIVTAGGGPTAKVWDARPETPRLVLKGHAGQVLSAAFSPDGSLIVTGGRDRTAKVWDARTGMLRLELKGDALIVEAVWFSADGTRIVTGLGPAPTVWDARTGRKLTGEPVPPLCWSGPISPDGRSIAHPAGNRVELVPLRPDAAEISYRRIQTRPHRWRYREGYDAARAVQDDFAARFYLKLLPPPERALIEAETVELDRAFPADVFAP